MSSCTVYGCPRDKVYALIRSDGKLSRFSFSQSVLRHCGDNFLDEDYSIKHMSFLIGEKLSPGEESRSGCYAIVAAKGSKGRALRICYTPEMAAFLSDPGHREVYEFWLFGEE